MTLTRVFRSEELALKVAESAKEIAPSVSIKILLPSSRDQLVTVTTDKKDWLKVSILGFALGLIGAYIVQTMGAGWGIGLVGLATGAIGGVLIGVWLNGESLQVENKKLEARCREALDAGKSVVIAQPRHRADIIALTKLFEQSEEEGQTPIGRELITS